MRHSYSRMELPPSYLESATKIDTKKKIVEKYLHWLKKKNSETK